VVSWVRSLLTLACKVFNMLLGWGEEGAGTPRDKQETKGGTVKHIVVGI
jgi:hypothetical protein